MNKNCIYGITRNNPASFKKSISFSQRKLSILVIMATKLEGGEQATKNRIYNRDTCICTHACMSTYRGESNIKIELQEPRGLLLLVNATQCRLTQTGDLNEELSLDSLACGCAWEGYSSLSSLMQKKPSECVWRHSWLDTLD